MPNNILRLINLSNQSQRFQSQVKESSLLGEKCQYEPGRVAGPCQQAFVPCRHPVQTGVQCVKKRKWTFVEWPDTKIGRKMPMKRWSQQWTGLDPGTPNKQFGWTPLGGLWLLLYSQVLHWQSRGAETEAGSHPVIPDERV